METQEIFTRLGSALLIGLLVGLQRERTSDDVAGIRTFALIALSGALTMLLATSMGGIVLAAGYVALSIVLLVGNLLNRSENGESQADPGLTTEVAAIVIFSVGAYAMQGPLLVAGALGGTVALLLHAKRSLHRFAGRLTPEELHAIMQFTLLSFILLPLIPDRTFGPYGVVNPHEVWLMVVLIVGISLVGYITLRFLGARAGMLIGGFLGGMVSSTATTVSYARLSRSGVGFERVAAVVVMGSCSILNVRVLTEMALISRQTLLASIFPIGALLVVSLAMTAITFWRRPEQEDTAELPSHSNPSELRSAFAFAFIYAIVILALAWAQERFGTSGLYLVGALSGLTDMDAITLSSSRMVEQGQLSPDTAWRVVLIAGASNSVVKWILTAVLGGFALARRLIPFFIIVISVSLSLALFL